MPQFEGNSADFALWFFRLKLARSAPAPRLNDEAAVPPKSPSIDNDTGSAVRTAQTALARVLQKVSLARS
jgi:hypothetical protein